MKRALMLSLLILALCYSLSQAETPYLQTLRMPDTTKPITADDLWGFTLRDLWIIRNGIFARHGKPFMNYELHAYFTKNGIEPNKEYTDSRLTDIERANVEVILAREAEVKKITYLKDKDGTDSINLGSILNLFHYPKLPEDQERMLSANGFVVNRAKHEQLFHVYEQNAYNNIPNFITVDSVLQLYSIFFDFTLRRIEEKRLLPTLKDLTAAMVRLTTAEYEAATDKEMKLTARNTLAYFSVPHLLLGGKKTEIHKDVLSLVESELQLIKGKAGWLPPSILSNGNPKYDNEEMKVCWVDYTQFVPRGHYTRTDDLEQYFMASLWYGLYPLNIDEDFETETRMSLLTTYLLYSKEDEGRQLIDMWREVLAPTEFYVGLSDDLGPVEFKYAIDRLYGKDVKPADFADSSKLKRAVIMAQNKFEDKTKIRASHYTLSGATKSQGSQFRLLGQRYIPDSEIMQRLTKPPGRLMPKGLDVMAVFGSEYAKSLMLEQYRADWETGMPEYPVELQKLTEQFGAMDKADWTRNLYTNWIWSLKALIDSAKRNKTQFFTRSKAWDAKNLNTALASWAQLRHNTVLYAKQNFTAAESGDGGDEHWVWFAEPPRSYVEPNPEFFARLLGLLDLSKKAIKESGHQDEKINEFSKEYRDIVTFLKDIADKQANNTKRTPPEHQRMLEIGREFDHLTFDIIYALGGIDDPSYYEGGYRINYFDHINETDRRIPVISDVSTSYYLGKMSVLEEAVGYGNEMLVIVEDEGILRLMRGPVSSYYEFIWPAEDRLTDEKWQEMLNSGKAPETPEWVSVFVSKSEPSPIMPTYRSTDWSSQPGWKLIGY